MDRFSIKASYTKQCKTHDKLFSSDLSCPDCDFDIAAALSMQHTPVQQSARHNEGKTQTREIDPAFILGMGDVLTKSRAKYEHFNWCKPTKLSTPYESAMRHLMAFQAGEDIDKETGLSHLLHVATNIMFMHYHITNNPEECDDRFFKEGKK